VFRSISSSRHADAITPTEPLSAVAISPNGIGLPPNSGGSASATSLFEACSAFTHVSACLFARKGYPLDSTDHYLWWSLARRVAAHDLTIGGGVNFHGLLEQSVKQLAARA
jgi:hypothetical protein